MYFHCLRTAFIILSCISNSNFAIVDLFNLNKRISFSHFFTILLLDSNIFPSPLLFVLYVGILTPAYVNNISSHNEHKFTINNFIG